MVEPPRRQDPLTGGQVQGGSTLAQQYVKNALLLTAADSAEQRAAVADSLARKIRELRIAVTVERQLSKNQLLAAYLNVAYFDNEAYGIAVAAQRYFGTTAATTRQNVDGSSCATLRNALAPYFTHASHRSARNADA